MSQQIILRINQEVSDLIHIGHIDITLLVFATHENIFDCVYPCPCDYYSDAMKPCAYAPALGTKYQKRISDPLLDRIDIHIEAPRVDYEKLSGDWVGESLESIWTHV